MRNWNRAALVLSLTGIIVWTGCSNPNTSPGSADSKDSKSTNGDPNGTNKNSGTGSKADKSTNASKDKGGQGQKDGKTQQAGIKKDGAAKLTAITATDPRFLQLVTQLADRDTTRRRAAADQLQGTADLDSKLVAAMSHEQANVRRGAAFYLLGRFDQSNQAMLEAFLAALDDDDSMMRRLALQSVQRLDQQRLSAAMPHLGKLLMRDDETLPNRQRVARMLSLRARQSRPALAQLHKVLQSDTDVSLRKSCLAAISRVDKRKNAARAFVRVATTDADMSMRLLATEKLGVFGPIIPESAATLVKLLEHSDEELSDRAAEALNRLGVPALPELTKALKSPQARARRLAIVAIGELGPDARSALPALRKLIKDPEADIRKLVADAVKRINPAP